MKRYISVGAFVCAIIISMIALFLPPPGEIDYSVLILVAQLLILCATFMGVEGYRNIIKR